MRISFACKVILGVFLISLCSVVNASNHNLSQYFDHKNGCFILYDVAKDKIIERYNPQRCAERISADSTFKVPLSVMVFDQHLITQKTLFKWDGKDKGMAQWNHDQTPDSWLKNSVVWVSQQLTSKLGMSKIENYLQKFKYGNKDFSGDAQDEGLTHAWLNNSLKISADEQLSFLIRFTTDKLPVLISAMEKTKKNLFIERTKNGWDLYGKTGGAQTQKGMPEGWFVGWIKKADREYIFVTNITELRKPKTPEFGGAAARQITKSILKDEGYL